MASTWRDRIKGHPASFRGVAFFVESAEFQGGRQNAVHVFPFSETAPFIEDTGPKGTVLPVECFVVGDNYMSDRDDLIVALGEGGTGPLEHPHYGHRTVAVDSFHVREGGSEQGIARFSITFLQTPAEAPAPSATASGASAVTASVAAAKSSASSAFQAVFSTAGKIYDGVVSVLGGMSSAINTVMGPVGLITQDAAALQSKLSAFENSALALASTPGDLVTAVTGIFDSLEGYVLNAENVSDPLGVFLGIYGLNPGAAITPPAPTEDRALDTANSAATQLFVQRLAVVGAATLLPELTFASYEDAVTARERVTDLIDALAEAVSDDTFPDWLQLRGDLVKAVPGDTSDLPHLLSLTPRGTVPSLVLSYQLYGDVEGEADLLARNKIRHPGFIVGGVELEVLSRE